MSWLGDDAKKQVRTALFFAVAYFLADLAINRFAFSGGWTILWPLNGFSIAFLIRRPRSAWAAVLVGIELGTGVGELFDGNAIGIALFQRACSAAEVFICARLLPPFERLDLWLRTDRFARRMIVALALGTGTTGLIAALYATATTAQPFWAAFNDWATADALGIAVTLPFALSVTSSEMQAWLHPLKLPQFVCVLLLALIASGLALASADYPLLFLLFPTLLFTDLMLGFAGSALAILIIAVFAVYCSTHGIGPFGQWPAQLALSRDHALQLYLGFHALILLPVSIILMERRRLAAELMSSNERLSMLASLDGLTGLANRRAFDEALTRQWSRAIETGGAVGLALIDLDNFKAYNDLYGHAAGDRCLKAAAQAVAGVLQRPADLVARYGGEEFVLLLPDTDTDGVRLVADRVREAVFHLAIPHRGNPPDRVSISIGYASVEPNESDTPLSLIQIADAALYRAKDAGRNCVQTVSTAESLAGANEHFGETTRVRILSLLGRNSRRG